MNEELFTESIEKLFSKRRDVSVGIGDDAAALDLQLPGGLLLLAAVDQIVEKIHYTPETSPQAVAAKLLKRNISDIAAMGGTPAHALVTLAGNRLTEAFLKEFHEGLEQTARQFGISIIGGDVTSLPSSGFAGTLTILGTVHRDHIALRKNAKPGDLLYCTGEIGNSFLSQHHLTFQPRVAEGQFLTQNHFTCAMMDVSDGLLKDALRIAKASGVALQLEPERIPLRKGAVLPQAMSDGEDYELLFAVFPDKEDALLHSWKFETRITRIGRFTAGKAGSLLNTFSIKETGYDHLAS